MTHIPAMDTGKDKLHEDNPLHDAELVLYTSDAEWAEENPTHDILKELGLTSFSLWARWDDDGVEIPILGEASWHIWYSLSEAVFSPDPAEPVSDAFISGICEMVDDDGEKEWGAVNEETWENIPDVERYILHLTRSAFLEMDNPEPALIIDWCTQQERGQ